MIELIVSMAVLLVVGTIALSILFSSLRGTNKTNTIATVSQNGSFAILQMAKMIQGAQSLDSPSSCIPVPVAAGTPTPTPVKYSVVRITSFDGGITTFSCDSSSITSNSASLINTNAVRLEPSSCYFMCQQFSALDYPVVQINFALTEARPSGIPLFSERTASASAIPFQTSIRVRNAAR